MAADKVDGAFVELISTHDRFLLAGHEHPDGDCLGSQSALYHLLGELGKQVWIVNPDPVTRQHAFLTAHTAFGAYSEATPLPPFEVAVLLDCAHLARLGALGKALRERGVTLAVVDHHVGSEHGDGQVSFVDSAAPSTGTLIHRLYRRLQVPIGQPAAEAMFLSLVADTGWFRYSNTTTEALRIAAELVDCGAQPARVFDAMFRRNHPDAVALLADVLSTHRTAAEGAYAYVCMDKAALARASQIDFEMDWVLEPIRSVEGVEVCGLFKERFGGDVKVSLRASGDVDVSAIAREFGGGGHVKAAGATLDMPLSEAVAVVEAKVRDAIGRLRSGAT